MTAEVISFSEEHARRSMRRAVAATADMLSAAQLAILEALNLNCDGAADLVGLGDLNKLVALGCAGCTVTETPIGDHYAYKITPFGEAVLGEAILSAGFQ